MNEGLFQGLGVCGVGLSGQTHQAVLEDEGA